MSTINVKGEYITLGQLLKVSGAIDTGSDARYYLAEYTVIVNGEAEQRRGRKLRPGDTVKLPNGELISLAAPTEE